MSTAHTRAREGQRRRRTVWVEREDELLEPRLPENEAGGIAEGRAAPTSDWFWEEEATSRIYVWFDGGIDYYTPACSLFNLLLWAHSSKRRF